MYEEKEIKYKRRKIKKKFVKPEKKVFFKNNWHITIPRIKIFKSNSFFSKIDWKHLGLKLGVLLLAMVLIIFTISRINKYYKKENESFNQNIQKITDATLAYYLENSLPVNIGDSSSLVLEEMIKEKYLEGVKENNNSCDYLSSYVIITKTSLSEYRLKIYLECPDKQKAVEQVLACDNDECKIKEKN